MKIYKSKLKKLPGTSYGELVKTARRIYHDIEKKSRRTAYIRAPYFKGEKIFINLYFVHLGQKSIIDRKWRIRYFQCGLDLLQNTRFAPTSKPNVDNPSEILHRFVGSTASDEVFFVQVSEHKNGRKYYMSSFPLDK